MNNLTKNLLLWLVIAVVLMSVFNNALGDSLVKEIWIPEMAIQ